MAIKYPLANGNWSTAANWNGGTKPVAGDDVYAGTFTVNVDENINVASLNNTAISRPIATAQMTANNAPSPYVVAASNEGTRAAWQTFDRNYGTNTGWATAVGSATGWLSYDFASGVVIDGYTIYGNQTQTTNPRNWTFEGSNDNTNWTVLHTVTLAAAIAGNGTYSIASIGNSTSYRYYRINISLNGGGAQLAITELELYQPNTAALSAGGGFNFNTAGVTASVTGATPLSVGASNLLTFSHNTGTVSASVTNNITLSLTNINPTILYSGNGDLTFTCPNINITQNTGATLFISKTGSGTLTLNANLISINTTNSTVLLNSTNGNIILNGNLTALIGSNNARVINQSAGNLTINGNIQPPTTFVATTQTVNFSGTSLTINGQLLPGVGLNISTTAPTVINGNVNTPSAVGSYGISISNTLTVNGNVYGLNTNAAVYTTSANTINISGSIFAQSGYGVYSITAAATINITGSVYAGTFPAVTVLGGGTVNMTRGNIFNFLRTNAIWSPNLFIDSTVQTWQLNTATDAAKTLYVSGTFPNLPATSNVRSGSAYGPSNSLVGTMRVPSTSDVRSGVAVDATTGSAQLNAADIISGINASNDPLAIRLKSILTDTTAGSLMSKYNNV